MARKNRSKAEIARELRANGGNPLIQERTSETSARRTPVGYARVSSRSQKEDLDGQLGTIRDLIAKYFPEVDPASVPIYVEVDNLEEQDDGLEIWKLLQKVVSGEVNAVVSRDEDRLLRSSSPEGQELVKPKIIRTLQEHQAQIVSKDRVRVIPLNMTLNDKIQNEMPAENKRILVGKTQEGIDQSVISGTYIPPSPCYGYELKLTSIRDDRLKKYVNKKTWEVVAPEAVIVLDIHRVAAGLQPLSLAPFDAPIVNPRTLADWLNRQAEKTSRRAFVDRRRIGHAGYEWTPDLVRELLRKETYTGAYLAYFRESKWRQRSVAGTIAVPQIVPQEIFEAAQRAAAERAIAPRKGLDYAPLHLVLKCHCGGSMAFDGKSSYRCQAQREAGETTHDQVSRKLADHVILTALSTPAFGRRIVEALQGQRAEQAEATELADLRRKIEGCGRRYQRLAESIGDDDDALWKQTVDEQKRKVQAELDESTKRVACLERIEERRQHRAAIVDAIEVLLATGTPARITGYLAQHQVQCIKVAAGAPLAPASATEAMDLFRIGALSAAEAAPYVGQAAASLTANRSRERHPVAKGLHTTNLVFQVKLREADTLDVEAPKVLADTYDAEIAKAERKPWNLQQK